MDSPFSKKLLRHVSFRQLQIFDAINRQGSFTRAADELFLTQPTISAQIKKLEQGIGIPLFEHIGKQVHLTTAGKVLKEHTRQILETMENLESEIADLQGLKTGVLRLAVVTTAKYFVPGELGRFCEKYPGVDVELSVTNRERLLERMAENLDDLYIMARPPKSDDVEFEAYMENPLVVLAPQDHPLAGKKNIDPTLLAKERMIMRERGSGTRTAVEEFFSERDIVLNTGMELGSNEAIKQAVAANLGISVLSRHTLTQGGVNKKIAILDVEGFPITWHWHVGYLKGKRLPIIAQTYLDFIKNEKNLERQPGQA